MGCETLKVLGEAELRTSGEGAYDCVNSQSLLEVWRTFYGYHLMVLRTLSGMLSVDVNTTQTGTITSKYSYGSYLGKLCCMS